MKRIALLSVPDPRFPDPRDPNYDPNRVDYRFLIEQAVRIPMNRQTGATIDEMRKGIRVLDALEHVQDNVLSLEDADWVHLREKVEHMPWSAVDRRFVQFYDDVMNATEAPRDPTRADGVASA